MWPKRRRLDLLPIPTCSTNPRNRQQVGSSVSVPSVLSTPPAPLLGSEALVPLREGAPARVAYSRGSIPNLSTDLARESALAIFDRAVYADSASGPNASRLRTCEKIFALWGDPLFLLTQQKVRKLGASLKAGGYRSASAYLSIVRVEACRAGQSIDSMLAQAFTDARRSCERGLGPSRKVAGLPLTRLGLLPPQNTPWNAGGPASPQRALVAGTWWLTREVELSTARAKHVLFSRSEDGKLAATWHLPVSKADPGALGVERTHGCCCEQHPLCSVCPAHTLWYQRAFLRSRFRGRHDAEGLPDATLPLFPDLGGEPCSRQAMVETIRAAARHLSLPAVSAGGLHLWAGHSLRVGGAQSLAALGLDTWCIQLLGRWGSDTVLDYIRSSPLVSSHLWAARAANAAGPSELRCSSASSSDSSHSAGRHQALELQEQLACFGKRLEVITSTVERLQSEGVTVAPAGKEVTLTDQFVSNLSSGIVHIVLSEPVYNGGKWLTLCSWQPTPEAVTEVGWPTFYKDMCERCFAKARLSLKSDLVAKLSRPNLGNSPEREGYLSVRTCT